MKKTNFRKKNIGRRSIAVALCIFLITTSMAVSMAAMIKTSSEPASVSMVSDEATDISIGEKKIDKTGIDAWSDATGLMTEIALKEIDDSDFISELDDQRSYRYTFVDPVSGLMIETGLGQYGYGGTIYIRANGSVDPPDAPISNVDNVTYTFTDNIYDSIVVERDNIVIDGAGYTVQGTGTGYGIDLSYRSNVTVKNTKVTNFWAGFYLDDSVNHTLFGNTATNNVQGVSSYDTSNHIFSGNNVSFNSKGINFVGDNAIIVGNNASSNYDGISGYGSNIVFSGNNVSNNSHRGIVGQFSNSVFSGNIASNNPNCGIQLARDSVNNTFVSNKVSSNGFGLAIGGSDNTISGNNITNNDYGIALDHEVNNTVYGNTIINNSYGVRIYESSENNIYHNNFIDNTQQVFIQTPGYTNIWDDDYPSGGNYWSDYTGVDEFSGPYQNETRKDGIGDTPYTINAENQDRYPLMSPWGLPSTIYVPTRYPTIQAAINVANPGDTIFVYSGTYYENVVVNKTLTLIGENRATTIIDGSNTGTVVNVTSSNVSISGFTIQHSGPLWQDSGIYLGSVSNCNILSNNTVSNNNGYGIYLQENSDNNILSGNNITNNGDGIYFDKFSSNNSISGNNITNNGDGIYFDKRTSNNSISGNNITNNGDGIYFDNICDYNTISGNNITNNNYVGIYLDGICDYNTISGNNITNNNDGIYLYCSRRNSISGNNITANNRNGIRLSMYSDYNTISGNNITANNWYGIELGSVCRYNTISGNNITNNNWDGINLWGGSSRNTVSGNNITANNRNGIWLDSGYNTVSGNNITANNDYGIYLSSYSWNSIVGNSITANNDGVYLYESSFNTISGNNITNNSGSGIILDSFHPYPSYPSWTFNNTISGNSIINNHYGIYAKYSLNNNIYHNNFLNNTMNACDEGYNIWDDGYPNGGNYWSDFDEESEGAYDDYQGEYQNLTGYDGIVDNGSAAGGGLNPYNISGGDNQDIYPLINPFIRGDCNGDGIIDIGDVVYLINYLFRGGSVPKPPSAGDVNCDGIVDLGDIVYLINYLFRGGPPPTPDCCSPPW